MKKIFAVLAVLLVFSILLSGCTQQGIGSGVTQNNGPEPEMSAEQIQMKNAMQLTEKALEENNGAYCEEITIEDMKAACLETFELPD